jgi:hypothetical protein
VHPPHAMPALGHNQTTIALLLADVLLRGVPIHACRLRHEGKEATRARAMGPFAWPECGGGAKPMLASEDGEQGAGVYETIRKPAQLKGHA